MLLTSTLVVGSTVLASVKVYQDASRKRKKETPWTVYAEKMAKKNRFPYKKSRSISILGRQKSPPTQMERAKTALQKFKEEQIPFLLSDTRHRQLSEINQNTEVDFESAAEKEINHYLALSGVSLALTTAGSLFYPPLTLLSVPLLFLALKPFGMQTYQSLFKDRQVGVAVVDFIGIGGCFLTGNFFATALMSSFSNYSRKLLLKTEDHSRQSLINVFGEPPQFVWVQRDGLSSESQNGVEVQIPFGDLKVGDTLVVDAGQSIPIDGMVISGVGTIDQRALTGESQPVEKSVGDSVLASTILLSGRLYIQVKKTGQDTVAARIGGILNSSTDFKSSIQSRGQKIVNQGAVPTLALSALSLPLLGVQSALAVLFASFGYHMKLAAPVSVLNFLRITSENGILVKDGRCLELLSEIDTVVFDKTGTLTEDVPTVGTIYIMPGGYISKEYNENDLLTFAAAAEYKQTHPIALAITKEAHQRDLTLPKIKDAEYELGYGLKVNLTTEKGEEQVVRVGSGRFMEMCDITIEVSYQEIEERCHTEGHSLVYVAIDNQLGGAIELVPTIRPEAQLITSELRQRNIEMVIISGDHQKPTQKLAQSLGIDHYFAEVLPQDKASLIEQLQNQGKSVCFVGDGINDSIALKTAQVGISMRGASTVATDTAGIILMDGTLKQFIRLLDIANELDTNLTRSSIMTIAPGIICVGGVFFFHFGLLSSIMLYNLGLVASVSNAMWPMFRHQHRPNRLDGPDPANLAHPL